MKLQDALKRIFREFGMNVLKEKRFVFLLSDYKAFDDYPAVKQIIKAIVMTGTVRSSAASAWMAAERIA